ncbi:MAG: twin-arginine translocase TatA/TatE family subunit [Brevinematales bacterium]|jgi:sec-independent protein translocase protein TatA
MRLTEILVVIVVIVLVFGASRIPNLGKSIGEGFKELKRGLREADEEEQAAARKKRKSPSTVKRPVKKNKSQE